LEFKNPINYFLVCRVENAICVYLMNFYNMESQNCMTIMKKKPQNNLGL